MKHSPQAVAHAVSRSGGDPGGIREPSQSLFVGIRRAPDSSAPSRQLTEFGQSFGFGNPGLVQILAAEAKSPAAQAQNSMVADSTAAPAEITLQRAIADWTVSDSRVFRIQSD